jgi:hypothetical protein
MNVFVLAIGVYEFYQYLTFKREKRIQMEKLYSIFFQLSRYLYGQPDEVRVAEGNSRKKKGKVEKKRKVGKKQI